MPELPYQNAKYILFSDFDGTITTEDSNDYATDKLGMGYEERRKWHDKILSGEMPFRDAFQIELDSVGDKYDFEYVRKYLKDHIALDKSFDTVYEYAKSEDIPVVIVSSGMKPIIQSILSNAIGDEEAAKIDIISNDVTIKDDNKWVVKFRHPDSPFGHDKSKSTGPYRELANPPLLFFCGDGVSDLSAAKAADVLFVKVVPGSNNDLQKHVEAEGIPYIPFEHFGTVRDVIKSLVDGKATVQDVLKK